MTKKRRHILVAAALASAGALFAVVAATVPSAASDVRDQLTPELIAQHCIANGEGSNVDGVFMKPNGLRIEGKVLCTKDDLNAPAKLAGQYHDDDDEFENEAYEDD